MWRRSVGLLLLLTGLVGQGLAQTVQITPVGQWLGHLRGPAEAVAVSGHYTYVADYDAGLQVIDVSDPANPVWVGGYETPGLAQGVAVAVSGHYAYVADWVWGLQILRIEVWPRLEIALAQNGVVLSWPLSASGYVLQSTPGLSPPAWQSVTNAPAISADRYVLPHSCSQQTLFFRLWRP